MSMSVGDGGGEGEAVCEMNTTPLIDVMLVLLIMFILNVPMQTHATKVDMPRKDVPPPVNPVTPVVHRLEIDFIGNTLWNGAIIDEATLDRNLTAIGAVSDVDAQPEVHFRPDKFAKYEFVLKVMALAQKRKVIKIGFVGNEAYGLSQ